MMQQTTEKRKMEHFQQKNSLQDFFQKAHYMWKSQLTTQELFPNLESIQDGRGDACHGANHAPQAQVDQHEKEHDRPERTGGKMRHGLREGDECQTGTLNGLQGGGKAETRDAIP